MPWVPWRRRRPPILRTLASAGDSSIRDLARAVGVTHSAASQTVAHMVREELVELRAGDDARQRIVRLTPQARQLLPDLDTEWAATTQAAATSTPSSRFR